MNTYSPLQRFPAGSGPQTRGSTAKCLRRSVLRAGDFAGDHLPASLNRPACSTHRATILASRWMAESA